MYFLLKYSPFLGGHVSVRRRTCNFPFVDRQPDSHSFLRNLPRSTNPCRGEQYNLGLRPSSERDSAHGSRQKSPRSEEAMVNCGLSLKGYIPAPNNATIFQNQNSLKKKWTRQNVRIWNHHPPNMLAILFYPPKFNITLKNDGWKPFLLGM